MLIICFFPLLQKSLELVGVVPQSKSHLFHFPNFLPLLSHTVALPSERRCGDDDDDDDDCNDGDVGAG